MCWNAPISLTTFIIGISLITLLYYLDYDIKYIIIPLSFVFMQFLEFLIWIFIKNKQISYYLSILTFILIIIQPIIILYVISYDWLIKYYLLIQSFILIICLMFFNLRFIFHPIVSSNNHLIWNWTTNKLYHLLFSIVYIIFFLGSIYLTGHNIIFIIGVFTYLFSLYNYYKSGVVSTMWCWFAIFILIYMIFEAVYMKYIDNNLVQN